MKFIGLGAPFALNHVARAFATRIELAMGEVVQRFGWLFLFPLFVFSPNSNIVKS